MRLAGFYICGALLLAMLPFGSTAIPAQEESPFEKLIGRWVGDGRLGTRGGEVEIVKCRVTYRAGATANELKQSIRCASHSGSIEVTTDVSHTAGALSGTWVETTRNWAGSLSGTVNPRGFRVTVKGENIAANMDILVNGARQIIEIQFLDGALLGLTLVLDKG